MSIKRYRKTIHASNRFTHSAIQQIFECKTHRLHDFCRIFRSMPIGVGTPLYNKLKFHIKDTNEPSKEELNLTLSSLRANELARNLKLVFQKNASQQSNNYLQKIDVSFISYGHGETFPFKNISDYQDHNERRRVVVFYWSVLRNID